MRRGDDHDWGGVIEQRIVAQRDAHFSATEILHPLVEHQHVEITASRQLKRLLPRCSARRYVGFFLEYALQGATQPFVTTADEGGQLARLVVRHGAGVNESAGWCNPLFVTTCWECRRGS